MICLGTAVGGHRRLESVELRGGRGKKTESKAIFIGALARV
jgi:hypothetical protein